MKNLLFFFKYNKKTGKSLIIALLLSFVVVAFQIMLPVFVKTILGNTDENAFLYRLIFNLLIYALFLAIYNIIDVIWYRSLDRLGGKILTALREDLATALYYAPFKDIQGTGKEKIKNIIYSDMLNVFCCINMQSIQMFTNVLLLVVFLFISFLQNVKLGIVLLSVAVISFLISFSTRRKIADASRKVNIKMKDDNKCSNEYVDSLDTARQNNLLDYFIKKQKSSIENFINESIHADITLVFFRNLNRHFHQWAYVLVSATLIFLTGGNTGELVYSWLILDIIMDASLGIENALYQIIRMSPSFVNVSELIKKMPELPTITVDKIDHITFDKVTFGYADNIVIDNMTAKFEKGDVVRLKGRNGSGKTTFVKLLSRLLIPDSGKIFINDTDINEISPKSLFDNIVYVSQDETLINETIYNYFKELTGINQDDKAIADVIQTLKIDNPDNNIENLGLSLSGGQRKKLLFGKLILREPTASILIIDELENAMDTETRKKLNDFEAELMRQRKNHITFVISHTEMENLKCNKVVEF